MSRVSKKRPSALGFTWGRVYYVHEIGRYIIFEYTSKTNGETHFHCFVDGEDLHEAANSLDKALLVCIAARDGLTHNPAAAYAAKLLDLVS